MTRQAKTSSRNKDFNVATNSSASDIFRVCHDTEFSLSSVRQQDYVATKKKSVAKIATCNFDKLCHDKRKYYCDKGREEPQKECRNLAKNVATTWKSLRQKYLSRQRNLCRDIFQEQQKMTS